MAYCKHDNESLSCPICKKERHDQIFGGVYSDAVGLRARKSTSINYDLTYEKKIEEEEKQDEIMKEYVLNSFTTKYKADEEDE